MPASTSTLWQVTGSKFFRAIMEEILDCVIREMTGPCGGFYSTQDADSEGKEGKFCLWTPDEIRKVLGEEALTPPSPAEQGRGRGLPPASVAQRGGREGGHAYGVTHHDNIDQRLSLAEARRKLFQAREERVHPGRDGKVLTSWNGLMLAAFAKAGRILDIGYYRWDRFRLRSLQLMYYPLMPTERQEGVEKTQGKPEGLYNFN